jgi:NADPH-dependent 2,4-dienoyl-CoA reductase/sulfur reductase-like enzyme
VLNVYAAGDVALAYNVTAGRRIPAEHWRDAAQQGLVAGLSAAGHDAAWNKVPEFNADDDYRRATTSLVAGTSSTAPSRTTR